MCSISGYYKLKQDFKVEEVFIKNAFDLMRHRGPDSEKFTEYNGSVCLGHQRLSILDTTTAANQPFEEEEDVIVFNGEIYNYLELKDKYLIEENFVSTSDTEVLIKLLRLRGLEVLSELNGMFAFAWYNKKSGQLVLCRDRFGVKPLHWTEKEGVLYFSSEIKPLVKIPIKFIFNNKIIQSFISDTATDYDADTFVEEIFQIQAGYFMVIDKNGLRTEKKWYQGSDFKFNEDIFKDYNETVDFFENLLTDAIKLRCRADVPVCITLSGGLDSTTIYTLIKERIGLSITPITFKHTGLDSDESEKVFKLAGEYNEKVLVVENQTKKGIEDIQESLNFLEFPIWDASGIAYLEIYKAIKSSGFKVVLEGHGSDEQLGGYTFMIDRAWREILAKGRIFKAFVIYSIYKQTLHPALGEENKFNNYFIIFFEMILRFIKSLFISKRGMSFQEVLDDSFNYRILPIVLRTFDRLTMSQSIESRSPFMDYRIVEFTKALPMKFKVNKLGSKAILREILKKYHKNYIYKDKKKMGFGLNMEFLFKNEKIKSFFKEKIFIFDWPMYKNLKDQAMINISNKEIDFSNVVPIWKVASLEITKEMYLSKKYE